MKRARATEPAVAQGVPQPQPQPQHVTYNINTINNYFAPAPAAAAAAPAPAAAEARPPNLFATNAERWKKTIVKKDGKMRSVYVFYSCRDGTLKGGCYGMCKHQWVDIEWFAPADGSYRTAGKRSKFFAAIAAYEKAYGDRNKAEAEKQRAIVEQLRNAFCETCEASAGRLSPAKQACKDEWERLKREACARNGGCQNQECPERGEGAWCVLQADHGTNPKQKDKNGKPVSLSDYTWWSGHGGVAAMREEAKQIHQWICGFCHALEPTSNQGKRCGDPATMPLGKRSGTPEERTQYDARRQALVVYPKQQYVDEVKRAVGACLHCRRPVLRGQEAGFDWDHRDEATKCKGGLYGVFGGVSGLVRNCAQAASLDKVQPLLDAEMDKCDLLCNNCHHRKTYGYPRRTPVE
jgi:hypothetical protein